MQKQTTRPTVASSPTWESLETWLRSTMCAGWEQIAGHAEEPGRRGVDVGTAAARGRWRRWADG